MSLEQYIMYGIINSQKMHSPTRHVNKLKIIF